MKTIAFTPGDIVKIGLRPIGSNMPDSFFNGKKAILKIKYQKNDSDSVAYRIIIFDNLTVPEIELGVDVTNTIASRRFFYYIKVIESNVPNNAEPLVWSEGVMQVSKRYTTAPSTPTIRETNAETIVSGPRGIDSTVNESTVENIVDAKISGSLPQTFPFNEQIEVVVNHNRGRRPLVQIYTSGGLRMFATEEHLNMNMLRITFEQPMSGFVVIN